MQRIVVRLGVMERASASLSAISAVRNKSVRVMLKELGHKLRPPFVEVFAKALVRRQAHNVLQARHGCAPRRRLFVMLRMVRVAQVVRRTMMDQMILLQVVQEVPMVVTAKSQERPGMVNA